MKVLALNGSPDSGGNVEFLLDKVLSFCAQKGAEVDKVKVLDVLNQHKWFPCINCSSPCNQSCFKGTDMEVVFDKMRAADCIILCSPVYYGTVSGILKCFWDKTGTLRGEKALVGKKAAAITSGHGIFGGQETTLRALHDMALIQGMSIIGDGSAEFDAGHHGVASSGNARSHSYALQRCEILASRIMS